MLFRSRLIRSSRHNQIGGQLLAENRELAIYIFAEGADLLASPHLDIQGYRTMGLPALRRVGHGVVVEIARGLEIGARDTGDITKIKRGAGGRLVDDYVADLFFAFELT